MSNCGRRNRRRNNGWIVRKYSKRKKKKERKKTTVRSSYNRVSEGIWYKSGYNIYYIYKIKSYICNTKKEIFIRGLIFFLSI
jgi:ribonucleotide reductase beta subunit family protein with ferritin-like domain